MSVLTKNFEKIYREFRLQLYKDIFVIMGEREGSLSATEFFAAEVVCLLGKPTISQFAEFLNISSSHAAYKVKTLIDKGHLKKIPTSDKRTYQLEVTERFTKYYHDDEYYGNFIMNNIDKKLPAAKRKELEAFSEMIIAEIEANKGENKND